MIFETDASERCTYGMSGMKFANLRETLRLLSRVHLLTLPSSNYQVQHSCYGLNGNSVVSIAKYFFFLSGEKGKNICLTNLVADPWNVYGFTACTRIAVELQAKGR